MPKIQGLVAVLALSLTGGCGGGTTASLRGQLTGRSFVSESVEGWQLVAGTRVSVSFNSTGVSAGAGCNSFFGIAEIVGDTLRVSMVGSTGIGCVGPLAAQDVWLEAFLLAGPTLDLDDPRLAMTTADARVHLLDRKIAIPDRPLVGTPWIGSGFSNGMFATFGPGSGSVTLSLGSDGHVTVNTSCQAGSGTFTANASTITFDTLTYDGAPCSDATFQPASDQAKLVLDGSPVTYEITQAMLTVTRGQNSLLFHAAP